MHNNKHLQTRLQFFTGKGGVGKSTVVAGLAELAASKGLRCLIIEIDASSSVKKIFQVPFVGFVPLEVADNIWAININPDEALYEYIEEHVKISRIAKRISNNKILQYFFKAAPAVNELVSINKIWNLFNQKEPDSKAFSFDLILVDLPATGHALSFLGLPDTLGQLIKVGPLRKMLNKYNDLLKNPATTRLNLVTLAEEMPVSETIELYHAAHRKLNLPMGSLYINSMPEKVFNDSEALALNKLNELSTDFPELQTAMLPANYALTRQKLSESLTAKLAASVKMELVKLPRIMVGRFDLAALKQLAGIMQEAM